MIPSLFPHQPDDPENSGIVAGFRLSDSTARKIVFGLFLLYTLAYSTLSILRHNGLNSSMFDLGIVDQAIWNTGKGRLLETVLAPELKNKNYFGIHFSPILLLFAPLYWIWDNVAMILVAQSILLGTGVFAVYRFARLELKDPVWGLLFCLLYVFYPPLGFINRFDFHQVAFAIPLFLFAWSFHGQGRLKMVSLCLGLALCCKESVGVTLFVAGLVMAFTNIKRRRFWLFWSLTALTVTVVGYLVIIPFFKGSLPLSASRYDWLGKNPAEIIRRIVSHPLETWTHQFGVGLQGRGKGELRKAYLPKMFLPLLFLPFLGGPISLAAIPTFCYNLLSGNVNQASIYFQYNSPIIPFLFIGAILGFKRILKWCIKGSGKWIPGVTGGLLLLSCAVSFLHDNPFTKVVHRPFFQVFALQPVPGIREFHEAARLIPPDASLQTNYAYAPHLSHRRIIFHLHWWRFFADYIFVNMIDFRWHMRPRHIREILNHPDYEVIYSKNNVVLLKRKTDVPDSQKECS